MNFPTAIAQLRHIYKLLRDKDVTVHQAARMLEPVIETLEILQGIQSAKDQPLVDLGSFAQYANDD